MKPINLIQVKRANVPRYYPDPKDNNAIDLLKAFKQQCLSETNYQYLNNAGISFKVTTSSDPKYTNPKGLLQ